MKPKQSAGPLRGGLAALAVSIACTVPAFAQQSPADVTDAQIKQYKTSAEKACTDAGKAQGDPPKRVAEFCKCMTGVFEKNLTKTEWQKVVYFSANDRHSEEVNVLGPHMNKIRECRLPVDPPGAAPAKPAAKAK